MKEEAKKLTDGYTNTMQEMWEDYVNYLNGVVELCQNTPLRIKKGRAAGNTFTIEIPDAKYKLCDIYEDIKAWTEWSAKVTIEVANIPIHTVGILCRALGETAEYALNIIEQGVEYSTKWLAEKLSNLTVNSKWVKKIIKKTKIVIIHVKKALLYAKLWTLKQTKKVLSFAANNKVTSALQTAYVAVINFILSMNKVIEVILKMIESLLSSLIGFTLDGGCMGFFTTPKSIVSGFFPPSNGTMKPMNANQDIYSNITDAIITPIEEGFRQASLLATQIKAKEMEAEIAKNTATIVGTDDIIDIPDSTIKLEKTFDSAALKAAITVVLSLLFTPEPLPKYERLHPGNLGFMAWLLTSFEPTMKKCFGLPGFP